MASRRSPLPTPQRLPPRPNQYNPNSGHRYFPNSRSQHLLLQQPLLALSPYPLPPWPLETPVVRRSPSFSVPPPPPASPPPPPPPPSASQEDEEERVETRISKSNITTKSKQMLSGLGKYELDQRPNHEGATTKQPKPRGLLERLETVEERNLRKKREYEMMKIEKQKNEEKWKSLMTDSRTPDFKGNQITNLLRNNSCHNRLKRETTFLGKLKFRNELPDPTAPLKLMPVKKDIDRLTEYGISSLDKSWKPELHVAPDLGIPLDLLDLSVYNPPKVRPPLAPEDEALLRDSDDEAPAPAPVPKTGIRIKERPNDKEIPWLVKTQYVSSISSDYTKQNMSEIQTEELRGKEAEKNTMEDLKDRGKRIKEIEAGFEAAKSLPVHPTNKSLKPVEILPLLPDIERLADQFILAKFDGSPTEETDDHGKPDASVREASESRAILKSCVASEDSGTSKPDKFLAYMVPSEGKLSKGSSSNETEDAKYTMIREYDYDVQADDANDSSTYLISFKEDAARYVPLSTRLDLKKRKAKKGQPSEGEHHSPPPANINVNQEPTGTETDKAERGVLRSQENVSSPRKEILSVSEYLNRRRRNLLLERDDDRSVGTRGSTK